MANLIQATVYQIDGAPQQPSPITLDFRTREVVIKEATVPTIAAVQSAILFYNVPNNPLSLQTFYVSEDIATLVGAANNAGTSQTQVTVLTINEDPQIPGGVQYSFPSAEILVGEFTDASIGVQAYIQYKNVKYYTQENEAAILAASNNTGVAAGTNPTSLFIPYNNAGIFGDSFLENDAANDILKTVYSASDIGLKLDFANALYSFGTNDNKIVIDINTGFLDIFYNTNQSTFRTEGVGTVLIGDIDNIQSGTSIFINDTSQSIFSRHGGNVIGLNLDFANNEYIFGNDNGFSSPFNYLYIEPTYAEIAIGSGFGLNFNIGGIARRAIFGDPSGNYNSTQLYLDDTNQIIKTSTQGNDIGLKLDFANNIFQLGDFTFPFGVTVDFNNQFVSIGDYQAGGNGTAIVCDNTTAVVKTVYNTADKGLNLDFANSVYWIGDVINGNMGFICEAGESKIGDYNGSGNGTVLGVSDSTEQIIASSNLSAPSAGSSSGQFLKIKVGGVDYKIALLNNA
jgi:hypothetical protein